VVGGKNWAGISPANVRSSESTTFDVRLSGGEIACIAGKTRPIGDIQMPQFRAHS
jgi:hypothetical protein